MRFCGRKANGELLYLSDEEIIANALEQEKQGIEPHYSWIDYKKREPMTPPGWLVWSLWEGCGVVYRREDGKMIIISGTQGDFCYC